MKHATPRQLATAAAELAGRHGAAAAAQAIRGFLAATHRSHLLPLVIATLADERRSATVELETADPVTAAVMARLQPHYPRQPITSRRNPTLLGGFRLHSAGTTFDASLLTFLGQLRQRLEDTHD